MPLARLIKKKREDTKITNNSSKMIIGYEKGDKVEDASEYHSKDVCMMTTRTVGWNF